MIIKAGIIGCLGRMGKAVIKEVLQNDKIEIIAAATRSHENIDTKEYKGIQITDSINDVFKLSDIVIDFTVKECLLECLKMAVNFKKPLVSGTTGISGIDFKRYATTVPILWSANMSVGANILLKLVKKAAELLGDEYDVEILEMHHSLKKDSPSGTALELAKIIAETFKVDFCFSRQVPSGVARKKGSIGFAVSRGGGIIGDHNVMFVNSDERVELSHKVINREVFAKGAVRAAIWLYENKRNTPGLYSMQEVI